MTWWEALLAVASGAVAGVILVLAGLMGARACGWYELAQDFTWRTLYEHWRAHYDPAATPAGFLPRHPGNPQNRRWWRL